MPSLPPSAFFRPHKRVAHRLAHDLRSSKREMVIGLCVGIGLAVPLFLAGHQYLERSAANERGASLTVAARGPSLSRGRLEQAVATLTPEPAHASVVTAPDVASDGPAQAAVGVEPAAKVRSKRAKAGRKSKHPRAAAVNSVEAPAEPAAAPAVVEADPEEPALSPAQRAGLGTSVPF
jgi:hypothetical protein